MTLLGWSKQVRGLSVLSEDQSSVPTLPSQWSITPVPRNPTPSSGNYANRHIHTQIHTEREINKYKLNRLYEQKSGMICKDFS